MTSDDFAKAIKDSVNNLYQLYTEKADNTTAVGYDLDQLELSAQQIKIVHKILKEVMIETTHCIFSGIEGETMLGSDIKKYTIYDDLGNQVSGGLPNNILKKFGVL